MKFNFDPPEQEVRIEIIPLIDVIFCILTFFILAALTLTRQNALNVDLPKASTATTQMRKIMLVSIDPIGQTYLEKQAVNRDQLSQALVKFQQANPQGKIVLYASRASSYNDVVQVLDLLKSVGGDRVALATLPSTAEDSQLPGSSSGTGGQTNLFNPSSLTNPSGLPNSSNSNLNSSPLPGLDAPLTQPNAGSKPNSSYLGLPETGSGSNKSGATSKP
jgi:biopolymer transport protein ExbD